MNGRMALSIPKKIQASASTKTDKHLSHLKYPQSPPTVKLPEPHRVQHNMKETQAQVMLNNKSPVHLSPLTTESLIATSECLFGYVFMWLPRGEHVLIGTVQPLSPTVRFTSFHPIIWLLSVSPQEMSLVGPESPSEQARRVFQSFDPEGK